jgi:hypothetical protein
MGSTISIDNTILGQSLLHKTFCTKIPFYHNRYINKNGILENRAYLQEYPIGIMYGAISEKIDEGLFFTINKVERIWGLDAGFSLYLYISIDKLMDDKLKEYNSIPLIFSVYGIFKLLPRAFQFEMNPNEINFDVPIKYDNTKINFI